MVAFKSFRRILPAIILIQSVLLTYSQEPVPRSASQSTYGPEQEKALKAWERSKVHATVTDLGGAVFEGKILYAEEDLLYLYTGKEPYSPGLYTAHTLKIPMENISEIALFRKGQYLRGLGFGLLAGTLVDVVYAAVAGDYFGFGGTFIIGSVFFIAPSAALGTAIGATTRVNTKLPVREDPSARAVHVKVLKRYSIYPNKRPDEIETRSTELVYTLSPADQKLPAETEIPDIPEAEGEEPPDQPVETNTQAIQPAGGDNTFQTQTVHSFNVFSSPDYISRFHINVGYAWNRVSQDQMDAFYFSEGFTYYANFGDPNNHARGMRIELGFRVTRNLRIGLERARRIYLDHAYMQDLPVEYDLYSRVSVYGRPVGMYSDFVFFPVNKSLTRRIEGYAGLGVLYMQAEVDHGVDLEYRELGSAWGYGSASIRGDQTVWGFAPRIGMDLYLIHNLSLNLKASYRYFQTVDLGSLEVRDDFAEASYQVEGFDRVNLSHPDIQLGLHIHF